MVDSLTEAVELVLSEEGYVQVEVESLSEKDAQDRGITNWPIWEREVSRFSWHYETAEECYIIRGRARIETEDGKIEIEPHDFVTFPAGLDCVWDIQDPVSKHYRLGSDPTG